MYAHMNKIKIKKNKDVQKKSTIYLQANYQGKTPLNNE
jgi:hypothetical protein